jgi:hypothetical protein
MASMGNAQRGALGGLAKLGEGARTTSDLSRVGGGLSRGANEGKKLNAAPWSDTFPAAGATLDLDFANNRGFVRGVGQGGVMDAITFTRASNGTFVKPDGTLSTHANQGALGNNLLSFPQDFDNSYWTKNNLNLELKAEIAPNGTLTAQSISPDATNSFHRIFRGNAAPTGETYTFSVYVKSNGAQWIGLRLETVQSFDVLNGIKGLGSLSSSITDVGNGWYRCVITEAPSINSAPILQLANSDTTISNPSFVGDGESGIFIWGAQLEVGSTATEYFPTNIGEPRFDWASTEQVARRNLLRNTATFASPWELTGTATLETSATVTPDGTTDAFRLQLPNANDDLRQSAFLPISGNYTASFYAKSRTGVTQSIRFGVAGSLIFNVGTEWERIETSPNLGSGARRFNIIYNTSAVDIDIWQPQLEFGTVATDYEENGEYLPSYTPLRANPTSNGILIEEARTNRLLWNRDATQTEWVKTNITAAKDQTGIDGVANAASSLTATDDNGTCIQTITLAAGNRTGSVYLKRLIGTGNIQVTLDGSTYSTVDLSDTEWYRIVLSGSVTNPTVGIKIAVDGDAVAMDYGQVEDGLFATTPILTTTATATRALDSGSLSGNSFFGWYTQQKGTIVTEFVCRGFASTARVSLEIGISGARIAQYLSTSSILRRDVSGGGPLDTTLSTFINTPIKTTYSFSNTNFAGYDKGGAVGKNFTGQVPYTSIAYLCSFGGGLNLLNGTLKRVYYIPESYNENKLIALAENT